MKTIKTPEGHTVEYDLTVEETLTSIRRAKKVFLGVILIEQGDPEYIPTSKAIARRSYEEMLPDLRAVGVEGKFTTTARYVRDTNIVYIN